MIDKVILLVEDNANDELLTLRALKKSHILNPVVVVRDGAEALDFLFVRGAHAGRDPGMVLQLVLLDLKLPKVDGLEVLEQIKSDAALKAIPVVMLTSSREEQDLTRSYDLGVNAYVVKPGAFDDFTGAIRELGLFWAVINEPPAGSVKPKR